MKLLRYGAMGEEKPGLLGADGVIRDLSAEIADITGDVLSPERLSQLAALDCARSKRRRRACRYPPSRCFS